MKSRLLALAFAWLLASHCAGQDISAIAWKPLFQGVSSTSLESSSPRPVKMRMLKIDLKQKGLSFLATPGNGAAPGETDGLKTTTFLKKYELQAAINAAPYDPVPLQENGPINVCGLAVAEGKVVSPFSAREKAFPALIINKSNEARISAPPFEKLDDAWNVVCGFHIVLKNGSVLATDQTLHPRTAVGLGKSGKEMIWFVIDGRQHGVSEGATTQEVGQWLKALGCTEGINLDGGGTTTLVVQEGDKKNSARILNTPVHLGLAGLERVSGSHLGLRAPALR